MVLIAEAAFAGVAVPPPAVEEHSFGRREAVAQELAPTAIKQEPLWPLPYAVGAAADIAVTPPAMQEQSVGSGAAVAPAMAPAPIKQEPLWPVTNAAGAAADVATALTTMPGAMAARVQVAFAAGSAGPSETPSADFS